MFASPPKVSITNPAYSRRASAPMAKGEFSQIKSLHTIDFFKGGVLDMDPFVFGKISAIHAISDIFAMGVA